MFVNATGTPQSTIYYIVRKLRDRLFVSTKRLGNGGLFAFIDPRIIHMFDRMLAFLEDRIKREIIDTQYK